MRKSNFFNCVLLVDDDQISNFIHTKVIEKLHITDRIVAKENGEEALLFLKENMCPELILLDINMPIMNGFEFIEAFQKETFQEKEKTKIVILSSSDNIEDKTKIDAFGFPFLNKPITVEIMAKVIDKVHKV